MATRGKASVSSSGASMSKYDVEVEARLQALEKAVAELQSHSHDAPAAAGDTGKIERVLKMVGQLSDDDYNRL